MLQSPCLQSNYYTYIEVGKLFHEQISFVFCALKKPHFPKYFRILLISPYEQESRKKSPLARKKVVVRIEHRQSHKKLTTAKGPSACTRVKQSPQVLKKAVVHLAVRFKISFAFCALKKLLFSKISFAFCAFRNPDFRLPCGTLMFHY